MRPPNTIPTYVVASGADAWGRVVECYTPSNDSRIKVLQMICCVAAGSVSHYVGKQMKTTEILGCAVCGLDDYTEVGLNSIGFLLGILE